MIQSQEFKNGIVYQGDCLDIIDSVKNFDHVLTDPPYGYLNHRIETYFDHKTLFTKIREKISDKGCFLIFGRGDLFYEWNLFLRDLGFIHKEDCVLYKNNPPNVFGAMMRYGEYYSIRSLQGFTFNKVYIPITDTDNISNKQIADWHRRMSSNGKYKEELLNYIKNGVINYNQNRTAREYVSAGKSKNSSRDVCSAKSLINGKRLSNVLHSSRELLKEGSHPTIKPSKEIGYLIQAISNENDTIFDPFLGSGTTAIATININRQTGSNRKFIGIELDNEYFDMACKRIDKHESEYLY